MKPYIKYFICKPFINCLLRPSWFSYFSIPFCFLQFSFLKRPLTDLPVLIGVTYYLYLSIQVTCITTALSVYIFAQSLKEIIGHLRSKHFYSTMLQRHCCKGCKSISIQPLYSLYFTFSDLITLKLIIHLFFSNFILSLYNWHTTMISSRCTGVVWEIRPRYIYTRPYVDWLTEKSTDLTQVNNITISSLIISYIKLPHIFK